MTYQDFQLEGYLLSEDEALKTAKQILEEYKAALKEIDDKIKSVYAKTAGMTSEERYNWFIQYNRRPKLYKEINDIYVKHDIAALQQHIISGKVAMSNNYYRQLYISQWVTDALAVTLSPKLIEYAVTGQLEAWSKLKKKLGMAADWAPASGTLLDVIKKNREEILQKIRIAVNTGMMGKSYQRTARDIRDIIGAVTNGEASGQLAKALRIARTEGNRLLNAGAYAQQLELKAQGIEVKKMWDATLDSKTRPAHGAADGQIVDIESFFKVGGESLMFPGDSRGSAKNIIRCRCANNTLAGGTKPKARRGRDPVTGETDIFSYKTFNEWAAENNLTRNKHGQIIGV